MRGKVLWEDKVPDPKGSGVPIHSVTFSPDGDRLLAAAGARLLMYEASSGDLLQSIKGHKDTVNSVSWAGNGKHFASGGADKTVIVWNSKGEGVVKYTHAESVQCVVANPVTHAFATIARTDFGFWSAEAKNVSKYRITKGLCGSWTPSGTLLAIGQGDGTITVRNSKGGEKYSITKGVPVWSVSWSVKKDTDANAVLCAAAWDQTLNFYDGAGALLKTKKLDSMALCLAHVQDGDYLAYGGTDRDLVLSTPEGVRLDAAHKCSSWVWSCAAHPRTNTVVVGCDDGTIKAVGVSFSTVHAIYEDRYSFRQNMSDVIIQDLVSSYKVRIRCRECVKKIAVYRDRLAVQLPDRVVIYEVVRDEVGNGGAEMMKYRVSHKIMGALKFNQLVLTTRNILLCMDKKLQLFSFDGRREREWVLEDVVQYLKVVGGPPGREGVMVGLKSGQVVRIFVDNGFAINVVKHEAGIRCLDLSCKRRRLALVDDNANLAVYDMLSKQVIFTDTKVNAVAWNQEYDDMLCYSGNGQLSVRTGDFEPYRQRLPGFVVGFKGIRIFCLHGSNMQTVTVPQSDAISKHVEMEDHESAYAVACLGDAAESAVTYDDWRSIAVCAIRHMDLAVARKALLRLRKFHFLDLISRVEERRRREKVEGSEVLAEFLAYEGKLLEAAEEFAKAPRDGVRQGINLLADMALFDEATSFAERHARLKGQDSGPLVSGLVKRRAEWSEQTKDFLSAAENYIQSGQFLKAVQIIVTAGKPDKLMEVVRSLPRSEVAAQKAAAAYFEAQGNYNFAKETYSRAGCDRELLGLHVKHKNFKDAELLLLQHPEYKEDFWLPYADDCISRDQFYKASMAFHRAGKPERALQLLEQLAHNAVVERRFNDAGYYFFKLSQHHLGMCYRDEGLIRDSRNEASFKAYSDFLARAHIYHAYYYIHQAVTLPFKLHPPRILFCCACWLISRCHNSSPYNVDRVSILHVCAMYADGLGAFKLARKVYAMLGKLHLPQAWREQVEIGALRARGRPDTDAETILPTCQRCLQQNPLINPNGDRCIGCGHEFQRSMTNYEPLPLVEFVLADGIKEGEAKELIDQWPLDGDVLGSPNDGFVEREEDGGANVLRMGADDDDERNGGGGGGRGGGGGANSFDAQRMESSGPIVADRAMLRAMLPFEVFVRKSPKEGVVPTRYFRHVNEDVPVCMFSECGTFMDECEYEEAAIMRDHDLRKVAPLQSNVFLLYSDHVEEKVPLLEEFKAQMSDQVVQQGWGKIRTVVDAGGAAGAEMAMGSVTTPRAAGTGGGDNSAPETPLGLRGTVDEAQLKNAALEAELKK